MNEATATAANRCDATRRDGQPCASSVTAGDGFCFAHSPRLEEQRIEARRRGGFNSAKSIRIRQLVPPRLVPVFDALATALTDVQAGSITPSQASAMASVARAMVAVLTAGEMEERLRRLEADAGELHA